jgi:hypothetical protein
MSVFYFSSCRKHEVLTTGGTLAFSTDTLRFDTVFTAAGSFTTGLLIYNRQDKEINISSVRLKNGVNSFFHINVDGFKGNTVQNIKIAAHDSVYVFATVNIDPTNQLNPFIVTDSLVATLNGREFFVPFTAYGQNARYIVDSVLTGNITWDTVLPYVIVNSAQINPGATLNINAGCRIYMHQNSGLIVLGRLLTNGTKDDTVIFQGDRLDRYYFGYQGYPGEWGSLYFGSNSNGSKLKYTRIVNGGNAALGGYAASIWVEPDSVNNNNPAATPQLTLENCVVENSIGYGILSRRGTIVATNCLIAATGAQALLVFEGGYDSLTNCTFANYSNYALSHISNPTVALLNWRQIGDNDYTYASMDVAMRNCIIWGSLDSELVCDTTGTPLASGLKARAAFDHCIVRKGSINQPFVQFSSCLYDDPKFKETYNGDYHIPANSPAVNAGHPSVFPAVDLQGVLRSSSDIGCYQHTP